jgi:hypothetical protein
MCYPGPAPAQHNGAICEVRCCFIKIARKTQVLLLKAAEAKNWDIRASYALAALAQIPYKV